jgi:NAD(P)-dependent dehydrogenase (short-subunit alcohol dehydrogenase family)
MGQLEGYVAVVTGAGQGVGHGIALALADQGSDVAVVGRTLAKVEAVADEVRGRGVKAIAVGCDVMERDQVEAAIEQTVSELGRLDILVNNAQSVALGPVLSIKPEDAEMVWRSGFMNALHCMQAAYPHLVESGRGAVVNLGTGSALRPDPDGYALYAAVKEGVRTLSRAAAVEWGPKGIRVNTVIPLAMSPGFQMWKKYMPDQFDELVATVPLGRIGDCETDIGRAVAWLAGPGAGYITGTTLMLDGGQAYLR